MTVRVGIDTGGTFTDVVLYDAETGEVTVTKVPSTPMAFDEGVLHGIDETLRTTNTSANRIEFLSHGTTVGTNTVLEGEIPTLGLITNAGLEDVLEIGDQTRPALYDLQVDKPPALIPRHRRLGVKGRLDYAGTEIESLDEDDINEAVHSLANSAVESIVVSTLFSHLNAVHERRIGEIIETETDVDYTLSSAVYPESREYDRTVTTVLNEAIKIVIRDYLDRLTIGASDRDISASVNIMHSGGGVFGIEQAIDSAIRTVLSGPAAGAVAMHAVTSEEGFPNAIGLDMGGTSADVSIVEDGELVRTNEGEINDLPMKVPMIDVNTVGAGGGSIAWVDEAGGLRVGPVSAGANPGPVCYNRGGTEPTVTDANLILGRIDPRSFIEDPAVEEARTAVCKHLAEPLNTTLEEAALSVLQVANAKMVREIRRVTVERGHDPSEFTLVAFGGAGPMQATAVAADMNIESVLLPRDPGVFSARGLLLADVRMDESQAYRGSELHAEAGTSVLTDVRERLLARFDEQGFPREEVSIEVTADMRYRGQSYEVTVPLIEGEFTVSSIERLIERFHNSHAQRYGHAMRSEPVELVTVRVSGTVPTAKLDSYFESSSDQALVESREVYFDRVGFVNADVYDRSALAVGDTFDGPAIIEETSSMAVIPPESTATVTSLGNVEVQS